MRTRHGVDSGLAAIAIEVGLLFLHHHVLFLVRVEFVVRLDGHSLRKGVVQWGRFRVFQVCLNLAHLLDYVGELFLCKHILQ